MQCRWIAAGMGHVVTNPELIKKLENIGIVSDYTSPAEATKNLKEKWDTYSVFMKETGLKK